ncbi:MAG: UDP-N-acetylmuramate dehydrogenase [Streptosporangiales bacterium]
MSSLRTGVPIAPFTTLRLGGPAGRMVECGTRADLVDALREHDAAAEPVLLLGDGSNAVVADEGFHGTVVRITSRGQERSADGDDVQVTVEAGEPWDAFVAGCVADGLSGVEFLSGVPGLAGATPIQNVGAYGQEVAETITGVRVLDRSAGQVRDLAPEQCRFTYRGSAFKGSDRYAVLAVTFRLRHSPLSAAVAYAEVARRLGVSAGDRVPLEEARATVLGLRASKGMVLDASDHDTWSAGSFFTNPLVTEDEAAHLPESAPRWPAGDGRVKLSAAWLIEHAGFGKGYGSGRARISTKHTLALTNRGGATTAELLALAREVRDGVRARFGVELAQEPVLVGVTL